MNQNNIAALFDEWNEALESGDAKRVAALYDTDGILLPTVSNQVRRDHSGIEDYFVHFLAKKPVGRIEESNIRIFGDLAINSGIYIFTLDGANQVRARYTFVYRWNGQRWMIVEHHSSMMPEQLAA